MSRVGALLLPISIVLFIITTGVLHPHREDPMHHQAVFLEYSESYGWIAIHFAQWLAALMLCGGLIALADSLARGAHAGAVVAARFGRLGAVVTATAFTMLQAVDGVALKWAVDAWAAAPVEAREPYFTAAMALRWTEYALQSYSNLLLGLTLVLFAWSLGRGTSYPRWLAWGAAGAGISWIVHGVMASYVGLFNSIPRLVGIVLLSVWAFITSVLMWRDRDRPAGTVAAA